MQIPFGSISKRATYWIIGTDLLGMLGMALWYFAPFALRAAPNLVRVNMPPGIHEQGAVVFRSRNELQGAYPDAHITTEQLIDFDREDLVRATWCSPGVVEEAAWRATAGRAPVIISELSHTSRLGGKEVWLSTQSRVTGRLYAVAQQLYHEKWLTVPKGTDVAFNRNKSLLLRDCAVGATVIVMLGMAFAIVRR